MREVRSPACKSGAHTDRNRSSSSLQRIESSNVRLERRFSQIETFIQKADSQPTSESEDPTISCISDQAFKSPVLSAALMNNAEIGRRRWPSIGIDEWIQAGRWWLLKVFLLLPATSVYVDEHLNSLKIPPPRGPDPIEFFLNKAILTLSKHPGY